jgi:hypothetical protein
MGRRLRFLEWCVLMEWLSLEVYNESSNARAVNVKMEVEAISRMRRAKSAQVAEPCAFALMAAMLRVGSAGTGKLGC